MYDYSIMKKFLASVLIVAIASGILLYLGWTSLKVPAGKCGVLITKTHGIDEEPLKNGKFVWKWYTLLPTNTCLKTFSIAPHFTTKTITGALPSADVYAANTGVSSAFTWRFTFDLTIYTSEENIVELLKEEKISSDEDLKAYLDDAAETISQLAASYILQKVKSDRNFNPETIRMSDLFKYISFGEDYPLIELEHFAITESVVPDYELYEKARTSVFNPTFENASEVSL